MNNKTNQSVAEPKDKTLKKSVPDMDNPKQDDRYPGSFYKVPGPPIPGKTTWSIC